jgi:hypothetical protein
LFQTKHALGKECFVLDLLADNILSPERNRKVCGSCTILIKLKRICRQDGESYHVKKIS